MRPPRRQPQTPPRLDLPRLKGLRRPDRRRLLHNGPPRLLGDPAPGPRARESEPPAVLPGVLLLRQRRRLVRMERGEWEGYDRGGEGTCEQGVHG